MLYLLVWTGRAPRARLGSVCLSLALSAQCSLWCPKGRGDEGCLWCPLGHQKQAGHPKLPELHTGIPSSENSGGGSLD